MSSDTKNAALLYYTTVDEQKTEDVVALFSADATYRRPGYEPLVGATDLLAFYGDQRVIAGGRHIITGVVAEGDKVAVEGQFRGVLRDQSGVEIKFADFFVFRDGLISQRNTYFDAAAV